MAIPAYETIILSSTDISEPEYAIRYYKTENIDGMKSWVVEFYDNKKIYTYKGQLSQLTFDKIEKHMFDYCPLQGIANNKELMGDAEKVLTLIDDYDKVLSDNSNEVESFVHAYMIFKNLNLTEDAVREAQARLQDNIYRFSQTPNLNDDSFGSASGISLKFKLHGLETKCGMFEAKMMDAAQYMWKLLTSAWNKKGITVDPLQITMDFNRNFPLDTLSEAQTVQALTAAGIPKEVAYTQLSFVDDVDYVMELIDKDMNSVYKEIEDDTDEI